MKDVTVIGTDLHPTPTVDDQTAPALAGDEDLTIDLRDDLSSVRGIMTSVALSAPVWIGLAWVAWWARHHTG